MIERHNIVYETIDGKIFTDKEDAIKHEAKLNKICAFKIFVNPDLCEGRHGPRFAGYLLVEANSRHDLFVEHWCYSKYGNGISFVQGFYGSNAIIHTWNYSKCDINDVEQDLILDTLKDKCL